MSRFPSNRARLVLILTSAAVLGAACVKPNDPGVSVTPIKAEIVFGVKDPEKPVTPPNGDIPEDPVVQIEPTIPEFLFPKIPEFTKRSTTTRKAKVVKECPVAGPNTFAEVEAPFNVPFGRAADIGAYRWKRSGELEVFGPAVGGTVPSPTVPGAAPRPPDRGPGKKQLITGFEQRAVRNIVVREKNERAPHPDPQARAEGRTIASFIYTYETLQPSLTEKDTFIVTTYKVDTANLVRVVNPPAGSQGDVIVGEAERGISIIGIKKINAQGLPVGESFTPSEGGGLVILPLEIKQGESFRSVSSDSGRGRQTLRNEGTVIGRREVDMCGTVVSAWEIRATLTYTADTQGTGSNAAGGSGNTQPVTRKWTYYVAPQLGGLVVREVIDETNDQGDSRQKTVLKVDYTQGQLAPEKVG